MARRTSSVTVFAAILAALLAVWAPAALAHHKDDHAQEARASEEETKGNDRKDGYEDNSTEPQDTNHGADSDHDGDAGNDQHAYTEDDDDDGATDRKNSEDTTASSHPSGKDRYEESGGSGNQGRSESNPDDSKGPMRYEGTQGDDKPNGPGGTDVYDQDGNNGCGNDQDFDDDNNGWCGKPTRVKASDTNKSVCDADANMPGLQKCEAIKGDTIVNTPTKPCDADATMAGVQKCEKPDEVQGGLIAQPTEEELVVNPSVPTVDSVLGVRVTAAAQPARVGAAAVAPAAVAAAPAARGGVLPFTGTADLLPLLSVALMLLAAGSLSLRGSLSKK